MVKERRFGGVQCQSLVLGPWKLAGQLPESLRLALEPQSGDKPSPRQLRQLARSIERTLGASLQVASPPATRLSASRKSASSRVVELDRVARVSNRSSAARRWWTTFGVCAGISVAVAAAAKFKASLDTARVPSPHVAIALPHIDPVRIKGPSLRSQKETHAPVSNSEVAAPTTRVSPPAGRQRFERTLPELNAATDVAEPQVAERPSLTAGTPAGLPQSVELAEPSPLSDTRSEVPAASTQSLPQSSV